MFEGLSERLNQIFKNLRRKGKLSIEDVDTVLRDIRIALLEADVNYLVVKDFINEIKSKTVGIEISQSLNPAQQVIKIVHEEIIHTLGEPIPISLKGEKPRKLVLVGLQGSGKTTAAIKLGRYYQMRGERVMLVAADPYRPAADIQLMKMAEQFNISVFSLSKRTTKEIVKGALQSAKNNGSTLLIIDTAGRSQMDSTLMDELKSVQDEVDASEILLVVDAMTGQEAVKIAEGFKQVLPVTGLFLTKMDGDARGGAAISIRQMTGIPIKLIGSGETYDAIEEFNPKRLADRILGMGDIVGLIEKAEQAFDQNKSKTQLERIKKGKLTLEDYAEQLQQIRKLGTMSQLLESLPGQMNVKAISPDVAASRVQKTLAIIQSMTIKERRNPEILNANRRKRIAAGSGFQVHDVNRVVKEFNNMTLLIKKFGKLDKKGLTNLLG